jgi:hypothetical protein
LRLYCLEKKPNIRKVNSEAKAASEEASRSRKVVTALVKTKRTF